MDNNQLRAEIVRIEKKVSILVSKEVEAIRTKGGDVLAHEVLASVASLFMARATGILHLWTNEKLESIRMRVLEAYNHDLKSTVIKLKNTIQRQEA